MSVQDHTQSPHNLSWQDVENSLQTSHRTGLSDSTVVERTQQYGKNRITGAKPKSAVIIFLSQLNNPLIYILLVSAAVTACFEGGLADGAIIFGVVLINAVIGYIQESKAEKSIQALSRSLTTLATVIRNGRQMQIDAADLVPGDIVFLLSGNKVPADIRLINTKDLQISESILTGESVPVQKNAAAALAVDALLGDRITMVYAGSMVTFGSGSGIVTATGDRTEVGKISHLLSNVVSLDTPLTVKFKKFSIQIAIVISILAAVTLAIGLARGYTLYQTLLESIALAVAAIPEGLPAAVTITLAIGVSRMARRRAIVRKLPAVEALGTVNVICSDKTGTLTQNQMTVTSIYAGGTNFSVSGSGYGVNGAITAETPATQSNMALEATLLNGILCNDSRLVSDASGRNNIEGDPTEGSLLVSAAKYPGISEKAATYHRIDAIPFESQYQYMAVLAGHASDSTIFIKGSVEAVSRLCSSAMTGDGTAEAFDEDVINQKAVTYAKEGIRVLAFAQIPVVEEKTEITHTDLSGALFTGLQAMIDPPREEVRVAIDHCKKAGIEVKMITGDHAVTAAAIAAKLGIGVTAEDSHPEAIDGKALKAMSDEALEEALQHISVFARVAPEEKLRIVNLLQKHHKIVAMTGDGVNDAPALKQADIGIAMGITGTDVSKEAADIVLTDDNFASIYAAIEEGRGVYDNLQKIILWTLPVNLGIGLIILASIFFDLTLPILPVQILWINMTTAGILGLALAMEPKERTAMLRSPIPKEAPILSLKNSIRTLLVGIALACIAFLTFIFETGRGSTVEQARTISVNLTVIVSMFYLLNCRSKGFAMRLRNLTSNIILWPALIAMLILQLLFTYLPVAQTLFKTAAPDPFSWSRSFVVGIAFFMAVELSKILTKKR